MNNKKERCNAPWMKVESYIRTQRMRNKRILKIMAEKKRHCGKGKPIFMIMMIGDPSRGKHLAFRDVAEELASMQRISAFKEIARKAMDGYVMKMMHLYKKGLAIMQPDYMGRAMQNTMFTFWQPMSLKRVLSEGETHDVLDNESKNGIVGLKYGKGTALRCWKKGGMMIAA